MVIALMLVYGTKYKFLHSFYRQEFYGISCRYSLHSTRMSLTSVEIYGLHILPLASNFTIRKVLLSVSTRFGFPPSRSSHRATLLLLVCHLFTNILPNSLSCLPSTLHSLHPPHRHSRIIRFAFACLPKKLPF